MLIHGLGSNPDTTWLAEAPEDSITSDASDLSDNAPTSRAKRYVNWVTEFLVHDLYCADQFTPRVFFFNYDSYWKRDALETRLCSMADKLLSSLELARDSETVRFFQAFSQIAQLEADDDRENDVICCLLHTAMGV